MLRADQRTDDRLRIPGVTDADLGVRLAAQLGEGVVLIARHEDARRRGTSLTGVQQVFRVEPARDRSRIDAGQDQGRRLAAKLERQALDRAGGLFHHCLADGARSGERHLVDGAMRADRASCLGSTQHHVDHPGRKPDLLGGARCHQRAQRRLGARGDHDGAARRQGRAQAPQRQHKRIVVAGDHADDADGLVSDKALARAHLEVRAQMLGAVLARELGIASEHRDRKPHLSDPRLCNRRPHLVHDRFRQLLEAILEPVGEPRHQDRAVGTAHLAPRALIEGVPGAGDRVLDLLGVGLGYLGQLLFGGGVEHADWLTTSLHRSAGDRQLERPFEDGVRGGLSGVAGGHRRFSRRERWRGQRARKPPSTGSATPVMKLASSLARKATALATSSGWPRRCIGTWRLT